MFALSFIAEFVDNDWRLSGASVRRETGGIFFVLSEGKIGRCKKDARMEGGKLV